MSPRRLESVTLVCVAGVEIRRAVSAMRNSMRSLVFDQVRLLSHLKPRWVDRRIEIVPIRHLTSHNAYNQFVLYELGDFIETDHCLLIQADGYVKNPQAWTDDFLTFDYIGAPWPLKDDAYIDPFGVHQRVGNGGFSLRSKRLLDVPQHHHVEWEVNQGDFYRHMNAGSYSEDGNICVHNRHVYESAGCRFAPIEVAAHFSRELLVEDVYDPQPFGFHRYSLRTGKPVKSPTLRGFGSRSTSELFGW